jgi:hypothetical protein
VRACGGSSAGLVVVARWSLMPAVVMLEGKSVGEARRRSRDLVSGHSVAVFTCIFVSGVIAVWPSVALLAAHTSFGTSTFIEFVWSALTAPFVAHVLTVIYYRRSDAERPVIDPSVLQWKNVWEGR